MAAVSKSYGIGDTVYVHYQLPSALYFLPQSRVVSKVTVNDSTNEATVDFSDGGSVTDGATVTVYTTQALAAAAIVTATIAAVAASVVLDTTTSIVSTAGNSSTTLGRIG